MKLLNILILTRLPRFILLSFLLLTTSSCSLFIESASSKFAGNLSTSILKQQDPELVKEAIPGYLLLLDSMIEGNNQNPGLYRSAASLTGSYAGLFISDKNRKKTLTKKALNYAKQAVCLNHPAGCNIEKKSHEEFETLLKSINKENLADYFTLASSWAGWIQAHKSDWNAIAQLNRVRSIMEKIIAVDARYQKGNPQLYLGVLHSILPAALGGKPETGKKYFEQAFQYSGNKNLMAKVFIAQYYCRLTFNQTLHDQLLNAVIKTNIEADTTAMINRLAQQKARALLASSKEYFE